MKGKYRLAQAEKVARDLVQLLSSSCERIEVVGSLRRRCSEVSDVELLCIPRYDAIVDLLDREIGRLIFQNMLARRLNKRGFTAYGPKNKLIVHVPTGIGVDIFSTTEACWPVSLVVRTGGKVTNQRISMAAIAKGLRFHAYGRGFTGPQGEIICRSERQVFEVVGLPYLEPWERE